MEPDELHREVQEHFKQCSQCQAEISRQKAAPRPFGRRANYCPLYWRIVDIFKPPEKTMHDA